MAIDTRAKRQSAHRVANPFARILPLADGTIDQADRQHAAGFYGGILAITIVDEVFQSTKAMLRNWHTMAMRKWRAAADRRNWYAPSTPR